jgi:hypothetical protein
MSTRCSPLSISLVAIADFLPLADVWEDSGTSFRFTPRGVRTFAEPCADELLGTLYR